MNEIYVEDIVDPELKLIGIKLNVFFVVTWSKFNQSIFSHVIFVTSQKHKWVISTIILELNLQRRSKIAINVT